MPYEVCKWKHLPISSFLHFQTNTRLHSRSHSITDNSEVIQFSGDNSIQFSGDNSEVIQFSGFL